MSDTAEWLAEETGEPKAKFEPPEDIEHPELDELNDTPASVIRANSRHRHAHNEEQPICNYCASFVSVNDGRYYCAACGRAGRCSEWR